MTFRTTAKALPDGRIELKTISVEDGVRCLMQGILDIQEQAIRDALIALGWAPPGRVEQAYREGWFDCEREPNPHPDDFGQHWFASEAYAQLQGESDATEAPNEA